MQHIRQRDSFLKIMKKDVRYNLEDIIERKDIF